MRTDGDNTEHDNADLGEGTHVEPGVQVGFRYRPDCGRAVIGEHSILRAGTIVYGDVRLGDYFQSGHHAVIRAEVVAGDHLALGHHSVLEGRNELGTGVRIMSRVYVPTRTRLGNHVFVGPGTTFLNDKLPGRGDEMTTLEGVVVEDEAVIGGGCTLLPGVRVGRQSFVAAGAVVTRDVPPHRLAIGSPARIEPLPEALDRPNHRELTMQKRDLWHPEG